MSDASLNTVDGAAIRRVMSSFCTGVTVVTGLDDQRPRGFTCQSLVSVSLDPPLVSFCPAKSSSTWPHLRRSKHICINVLAHDQQDICLTFAKNSADRFAGVDWSPAGNGAPALHRALAHVEATIVDEHDAGDHTIVVSRVTHVHAAQQGAPLLFFRGAFGIEDPRQSIS